MAAGGTAIVIGGGQGIGKAIAGRLLAQSMRVVIADIDREAEPHTDAYTAAKGGLLALTPSLAVSLGPEIRQLHQSGLDRRLHLAEAGRAPPRRAPARRPLPAPAGRVGVPEDVAALAAFLLSEEAGFHRPELRGRREHDPQDDLRGVMVLLIRCAACKTKLWRYDKIGPGEVLRCHKGRIEKMLAACPVEGGKIRCPCGKEIGIDKGSYFKMIAKAFTYKGAKRNA